MNGKLGEVEHQVVDYVKQFIPETIQEKWRSYRASMKKAETDTLGNDDFSNKVEMASWGVGEASLRNKAEASEFIFIPLPPPF